MTSAASASTLSPSPLWHSVAKSSSEISKTSFLQALAFLERRVPGAMRQPPLQRDSPKPLSRHPSYKKSVLVHWGLTSSAASAAISNNQSVLPAPRVVSQGASGSVSILSASAARLRLHFDQTMLYHGCGRGLPLNTDTCGGLPPVCCSSNPDPQSRHPTRRSIGSPNEIALGLVVQRPINSGVFGFRRLAARTSTTTLVQESTCSWTSVGPNPACEHIYGKHAGSSCPPLNPSSCISQSHLHVLQVFHDFLMLMLQVWNCIVTFFRRWLKSPSSTCSSSRHAAAFSDAFSAFCRIFLSFWSSFNVVSYLIEASASMASR